MYVIMLEYNRIENNLLSNIFTILQIIIKINKYVLYIVAYYIQFTVNGQLNRHKICTT